MKLVENCSGHAGAMRFGIVVLSHLVRLAGVGNFSPSIIRAWNLILTSCVNPSPKVRHLAAEAATALLSTKGISHRGHAAGNQAARFLVHIISNCNEKDSIPSLHALHAAKGWLAHLSPKDAFTAISALIKLPSLGIPRVTSLAFEGLAAMFRDSECKLSAVNTGETLAALLSINQSNLEGPARYIYIYSNIYIYVFLYISKYIYIYIFKSIYVINI